MIYCWVWNILFCFCLNEKANQASVRVEDEDGAEDEAEEEVDKVDVAGDVADVDEDPAEDDAQVRPRLKNVQPNVCHKGNWARDTCNLVFF